MNNPITSVIKTPQDAEIFIELARRCLFGHHRTHDDLRVGHIEKIVRQLSAVATNTCGGQVQMRHGIVSFSCFDIAKLSEAQFMNFTVTIEKRSPHWRRNLCNDSDALSAILQSLEQSKQYAASIDIGASMSILHAMDSALAMHRAFSDTLISALHSTVHGDFATLCSVVFEGKDGLYYTYELQVTRTL